MGEKRRPGDTVEPGVFRAMRERLYFTQCLIAIKYSKNQTGL